MPLKYPANIITKNEYRAVVTNPAAGCFKFFVISPAPSATFEWYSPSFKGLKNAGYAEHMLSNVEAEILQAYFQLIEAAG